jgi:Immunity protein 27
MQGESMKHQELSPDETDLVGAWLEVGGGIVGDVNCDRIRWLVQERLEPLATNASGWDKLLRDPRDGRLWELTYPQSNLHGGGPPRLALIAQENAKRKYDAGTA